MSSHGPTHSLASIAPDLSARDDLAARGRHDGGAHAAQDLGAEARHAIAQALEVLRAVDLLVEPAAHLHAGIRGHQRLDVERRVDLVPQCLPAAEVDPRAQLIGGHAVGHRAERNSAPATWPSK